MMYKSAEMWLGPKQVSDFELALQKALESRVPGEGRKHEETQSNINKNQNQGLINTIVNHDQKLKVIENNFNTIVNNFANSSHVQEVIKNNKILEKHVLGTPQPHKSWRDFVILTAVIGIVLLGIYKLCRMVWWPCLVSGIQRIAFSKSSGSPSMVNGQRGKQRTDTLLELKVMIDEQRQENLQMKNIMKKVDEKLKTTSGPT